MRRGENKTSDKGNMPLVTLGIISYNQEGYIEECFRSALAQDYPNLQIVLCDDHSTDHTLSIVERIVAEANSQHEIVIHQNAENLGIGGNVNAVFESATGELIVMMGGDDISYSNRCSVMAREWLRRGKPSGIVSMLELIDDAGNEIKDPEAMSYYTEVYLQYSKKMVQVDSLLSNHRCPHQILPPGVIGCTSAWSRDLYDFFGPLSAKVHYEDVVFTIRAMISNNMTLVEDKLVKYRVHGGSTMRNDRGFDRELAINNGLLQSYIQMLKDLENAKIGKRYTDHNNELQIFLEQKIKFLEFKDNYFTQPLWKSLIQIKKMRSYGLGLRCLKIRMARAFNFTKLFSAHIS